MSRVLLYNPPGGMWFRGEARCEQDISQSTAFTLPPPTTLCFMAAIFRQAGIEPRIVDCPAEGMDEAAFLDLAADFAPDLAVLNASVLNLKQDMAFVERLRRRVDCRHAAIVPYLGLLPMDQVDFGLCGAVDLVVTGEMEAVAYDLAELLAGTRPADQVRGVIAVDREARTLRRQADIPLLEDLDSLPLPARDLVRNELYVRPDTGAPMASIVDGRGCPSKCIYCLAPVVNGRRARKRSAKSVAGEMRHCVEDHGIREFLFRSDTFTINKAWVLELCSLIRDMGLDVSWAANSRVNTFDADLATAMKAAGCYLVEFGIESGSDESLRLMKKGTTTDQARAAVAAARKAGLLTYGTVLLGFPWEGLEHMRQTSRFVREVGLDFIEVQVVSPFVGTEFHAMALAEGLVDGDSVDHDMVRNPALKGTRHVGRDQVLAMRRRLLRDFYFRPAYIARTLGRLRSGRELARYARHGFKLIRNLLPGSGDAKRERC